MKMLTKQNQKDLPALYSQEEKGTDAIIQVKFFNPIGSWTWYATEFDGIDTFFGLVDGLEMEMGYFLLSELKSYGGQWGLGIERDMHFTKCSIQDIMDAK